MYYKSGKPELNTFAQVAAHYALVKPMRGKYAGKDVRPIHGRRQPWERIVKIDDNTYLLSVPSYSDPVCSWYHRVYEGKVVVTVEEQVQGAPIVWRRAPDGTETVTVRNALGPYGQNNSYYQFLFNFLPKGLHFTATFRKGAHFVATRGDKFYLALGKTVPAGVYEHMLTDGRAATAQQWITEDDGVAVTFKRDADQRWHYVSGGVRQRVKRARIDLQLKAQYADKLAHFSEYCFSMRPLLTFDMEMRKRLDKEIEAYRISTSQPWSYWRNLQRHVPAENLREMLDPTHPLFFHLACEAMRAAMSEVPTDKEDRAIARAELTRWINRTFGFINYIEEEV